MFASSTITAFNSVSGGALGYLGTLFSDFRVLVVFCIGLPLAFWGVEKIIDVVRSGFKTK